MADWIDYFSKSRPPSNLDEAKRTIQDFALKHRQLGRNIVLVTSGGTTVPLESNTVRYVDNFSQGTRGAASAEYFLLHGYAVIFLHRQRSLEPFCRHFEGHNALDILDLQLDGNGACQVVELASSLSKHVDPSLLLVLVDENRAPGLQDIVRRYKEVQNACLLLKIGFMTLSDYLFLLRASAEALSPLASNVIFYLAAAVSDFYIPQQDLEEHKIQSSEGAIMLTMQPTPKMMSPLVREWAKSAFVVSFKLETDVNIISRKARDALTKYNHQVVIANILQTRRKTVVLVTPFEEQAIWMAENEQDLGKEIEEKIVTELVRRHLQFVANASGSQDGTSNSVDSASQQLLSTTQLHSPTSLNQSAQITSVTQILPGFSSVNTNKLNSSQIKLALDVTGTVEPLSSPNGTRRRTQSGSKDDSTLTYEMQDFIKYFKGSRMALGHSQEDVGKELSEMNGPSYSQSIISRFEGRQLGMKTAMRMRPTLESWIRRKQIESGDGLKPGKKRRRRTSFSPEVLEMLIDTFKKNPKPTPEEIQEMATRMSLEANTIRIWFCNRKQSLRRSIHPDMKHDLDKNKKDDVLDQQQHSDDQQMVGHQGTITTIPLFINQDGVAIVASPHQQGAARLLPSTVVITQVPILPSMSLVNQVGTMNNTVIGIGNTGGNTVVSQAYMTQPSLHPSLTNLAQLPVSLSPTSHQNIIHVGQQQSTNNLLNNNNEQIDNDNDDMNDNNDNNHHNELALVSQDISTTNTHDLDTVEQLNEHLSNATETVHNDE